MADVVNIIVDFQFYLILVDCQMSVRISFSVRHLCFFRLSDLADKVSILHGSTFSIKFCDFLDKKEVSVLVIVVIFDISPK